MRRCSPRSNGGGNVNILVDEVRLLSPARDHLTGRRRVVPVALVWLVHLTGLQAMKTVRARRMAATILMPFYVTTALQ